MLPMSPMSMSMLPIPQISSGSSPIMSMLSSLIGVPEPQVSYMVISLPSNT
jgi:hypothetical protein